MTDYSIKLFTDVAGICIFAPECLRHRLNDVVDWTTLLPEVLDEINRGNMMWIDVGADGFYRVQVKVQEKDIKDNDISEGGIKVYLKCPNGNMYIGPAEMVTADGIEPDLSMGTNLRGEFIPLEPGNYSVTIIENDGNELLISFTPVSHETKNTFSKVPKFFRGKR